MGFKIGVVGAGQFSRCFIPLFQMHPFCDEVSLAELIPERLEKIAAKFGIKKTFPSLDEMLKDPTIDAVAIFTQRHLHGPQVVQALRSGKHVYSAVPMAQSEEMVQAALKYGLTSLGITLHAPIEGEFWTPPKYNEPAFIEEMHRLRESTRALSTFTAALSMTSTAPDTLSPMSILSPPVML